MGGTDFLQRAAYGFQIGVRQQALRLQHLRMSDRGLDIVCDEAIVERMIIARRVGKNAGIERLALVPQARHTITADEPCCSAGLSAFRSATTSVPVPSFVNTSASRLSAER